MSYQKFAQYARRGKHSGRRSVGRRVFSLLLLLGAVGGALWFLLGLRKLPVGELPPADRPPVPSKVEEKPADVLVQPVAPATPAAPAKAAKTGLPSFNPPSTPPHGSVTGDSVRMREDHSTASGSKVITRLSRNTRLDVLEVWRGQAQPWYRVKTAQGQEGWIRGDYVQPLGDGLPKGYSNALLRSFGDSRESLTNKLGQPSKSTDASMDWDGLSAKFRGGRLTQLRLTKSKHELENKLKVGMGQPALFKILGYPSNVSQRQLQYSENGKTSITIQLSRDGLVNNITVNEAQ